MQREIKFRMPIRIDGKFSHWHYWGFIDGEFVGPDARWVNTPSEQFTGLQDKSGVDIYEGDIVLSDYSRKQHQIIYSSGSHFCAFADSRSGVDDIGGTINGFIIFEEKGPKTSSALIDGSDIRIIGNTTENQELLSK